MPLSLMLIVVVLPLHDTEIVIMGLLLQYFIALSANELIAANKCSGLL